MFKKLSSAVSGSGVNMGVLAIAVIIFVGALCGLTTLADSGKPPTIEVLVAAQDLNMGDVISPDALVERTLYEDANASLYIPSDEAESVVGGVAALPIFAGQPIYRTSILAPAAFPYRLSAILAQYPEYSLFPLPLESSNVIAPDVSMFMPGDIIGITVVIARRPSPPATESAQNYWSVTPSTPTPAPTSPPEEEQKEEAEDRTAPPLAKDLFPNGVVVIMIQGGQPNTVSDSNDSDSGSSTGASSVTLSSFSVENLLILLVPNDKREELALAMQQGDQLLISLMGQLTDNPNTPGFTYWDFEALFEADRAATLETPVP